MLEFRGLRGHRSRMKRFIAGVLTLVLAGPCVAEVPAYVQEATEARVAAPGVWHVTPRRVVWKSEGGLEGVENLLKPGLGQSVLGKPKPVCVMKSGGSVVLDFGVEMQGWIEVFTGVQKNKTPVCGCASGSRDPGDPGRAGSTGSAVLGIVPLQ